MAVREAAAPSKIFDRLLDDGSFTPIRTEVRSRRMPEGPGGDGVVCGQGSIDGRRVFCYEQDPSVLGGSLGETHADSICRVLDLAGRFGAPVVGIHRSGGARIQEGVASLAGYGRIFSWHVKLRDKIPQVGLVFGPCAGGASYGPALMDFIVMPRSGAYMFLTGPDVVREVTGENVTFEELGGAKVAGRSGLATLIGDDEDDAIAATRNLLAHLPSRIGDGAHSSEWSAPRTDVSRVVPDDPKVTYDVRDVVGAVVDAGSFLELRGEDAPNLVVGLATIEGRTIGVIANQPRHLAGSIDIDASAKGAWFVRLCTRFGFPMVVFVDTPGFLPGTDQELGGVIPAGAGFLSAFVESTVPRITVVLRKAYGGAYIVMNSRDLGADYVFAWPTAEIAVLGARGAVKILERRRLAAADDPERLRQVLEDEYRAHHLSPWPAAHAGFVDEVIQPDDTRARLVTALGS
jgi:acetyl-CoA carboxylase carboxyltransferase component